MAFAHPEFLVSTAWLAEHLADAEVRVSRPRCSCITSKAAAVAPNPDGARTRPGTSPGSGFLDLQADFSDNEQPYRFMMPSPAAFAQAAGRHGISDSSTLVLYDRLGSQWAARFWWMFRSMGCRGAVVLDGGLRRWTAEGRATSTDPATYAPAVFNPTPDPARFADLVEVKAFIESGTGGGSCLINALGRTSTRGPTAAAATVGPGTSPGATNVPSGELIDPETGLYRPAEELAALFEAAGADRSKRVVTYCGGGIAASNDAFILAMLGYENVAVYDASMSEYAADPSLPLVAD